MGKEGKNLLSKVQDRCIQDFDDLFRCKLMVHLLEAKVETEQGGAGRESLYDIYEDHEIA
ncbi:hypothetical protein M569_10166 [Genlisea aurea]|uniref:Uncharacterized protein n=1 Tax=Genlisea aurea TaxID=192259 RepID=S8CCH8_9LAMI|nr:hypothetical protein M569_10166 [Genlisea aurea]